MQQVWRDTAASEMRMNLITDLKGKNLGFNEIENFSLGLRYNFKSEKMQELKDKPLKSVIQAAMATKMQDEIHFYYELRKKREIQKKRLAKKYHPNTKTYKKIINYLREQAAEMKRIQGEKYRSKVEHIENNYRDTQEEDLAAPESMKDFSHLSVFIEEKFDEIRMDKMEIPRIGEIQLSTEEEAILRRSPKFSVLQDLQENTIREDMEKAYSLVRMELREEDEDNKDEEKTRRMEESDTASFKTPEERSEDAAKQEKLRKEKEEAAKTRQVYDPIEKRYDERRRRVTDLAECSRVTLPKPLSIQREAEIETRRNIHERIYQEYRKERCNNRGEQESNMTWEEKTGLKSLMRRVSKGELLIMKTDKSGKMSVTTREKYLEMGREHVGNDKEVERTKIIETDKVLNEHSAAWCSIWSTGKDHEHQDRVLHSKTSRSENRANLYLTYKDHKKEKEKTRPIGTANSSNTRAFANSISDLLESIANGGEEEKKYEVISSEDLLHHTKESNRRVREQRADVEEREKMKKSCWECKVWRRGCRICKDNRENNKYMEAEELTSRSTITEILDEIMSEVEEMSRTPDCIECEVEKRKVMERDCYKCGRGVTKEENQLARAGNSGGTREPSSQKEFGFAESFLILRYLKS